MRKIRSEDDLETTDKVPWAYFQASDSSTAGLSAGHPAKLLMAWGQV